MQQFTAKRQSRIQLLTVAVNKMLCQAIAIALQTTDHPTIKLKKGEIQTHVKRDIRNYEMT